MVSIDYLHAVIDCIKHLFLCHCGRKTICYEVEMADTLHICQAAIVSAMLCCDQVSMLFNDLT